MPSLPGAFEAWFRVTASVNGRDKLNRFAQYFAKFLAWHFARRAYDKDTIAKASVVQRQLSVSRKLFRLGKPLESLNSLLKSLDLKDPLLRSLSSLRHLSMALYLVYDMIQWFHQIGVRKVSDPTKLGDTRQRWYFVTLLLTVVVGLYKIQSTNKTIEACKQAGAEDAKTKAELKKLQKTRQEGILESVKSTIDMLIPLNHLKYTHLEEGHVGLAGSLTSLIGLYMEFQK